MRNPKHPRKHPDAVKGEYLEMRLMAEEKAAFVQAAQLAGMSLSAWVRDRLRRVSRKELEDMNRPVAFLERLSA
jgi:uncharacterized protein (DUF1778 family)